MIEIVKTKSSFYEIIREELRLRNYSYIKSYISCLRQFVKYFHPVHPREINLVQIKGYLLYLLEEKKWQASTINQMFNALRFL